MSAISDSPIRSKSFQFACNIVTYTKTLKDKKEYEIASQLLKSGTSVGANVREAQRGVSRKDFKNKLGIALKEADETLYWLELIDATIEKTPESLSANCEELIRILVSILKNTK
ncbi:MAG TPA: four helix bundle protein [Leeuwenhoekiella sp.]|nr:four helix bundle protein [Leeuwenhoekiella sp.]